MSSGVVTETGHLPDGTYYRVWQCRRTGKRIVYVGAGAGKRRTMKWLKKMLKMLDVP